MDLPRLPWAWLQRVLPQGHASQPLASRQTCTWTSSASPGGVETSAEALLPKLNKSSFEEPEKVFQLDPWS